MGSPKWIIDPTMNDRLYPGAVSVWEACERLGIVYHETPPFTLGTDKALWARAVKETLSPWESYDTVFAYGSHQFVSAIRKYFPNWLPGGHIRYENLAYSGFSPFYGKWMLNDFFYILPFSELVRRVSSIDTEVCFDKVFLRPDKVTKSFTGFSVKGTELLFELNALKQLQNVQPEELIVIADHKEIQAEFRFVIVDGKVITGSEYRWDNVLDVRSDVDPNCLGLVEKIACHPWQPDIFYVADIALTKKGPKLIELNTLQCAGLYACDTVKVVEAVQDVLKRGDI